MATQQQLLQQHLQPPQPQQPRDQYSDGGENQTRGETSEYRGETEDPAIPVENVAIVKQFLKLKPPTFSGEMDPVKANEWLLEMEKNFRLLRCGEQQKVEIGSYLLTGAASRWWNLKGVRESGMNWARFKVIFKEKYMPRALQNAKCAEFEHLKQTGKPIVEYEAAFTNLAEYAPHLVATDEMRARRFEDGLRYEIKRVIRPLVLPTYADVLDRAIIVEQDEMEKKKYFDNKKRQNFNNQGSSGQKRQKPESNWRNQRGQNTDLGTGAMRGNQGGGNARPGENRQGNQGNRSGTGNNQRQGQAFALMPGDARNDEIVVAEQRCLHREMEELELEVISCGIEGLCATIIAEPAILEEIKLRQMEDPKLRKIHDNLAAEPNSEFKTRGETSEYRGETEDPAIPVENVAIVKQFLKLKPPTFSGEMDPVKANEWLLEMEKNFRLLRCGEQQKVEIGSYLLTGAASRWWNLKGVRESGMNWARFKVIFKEKYMPRALQNAKCAEFEHLKQTGKPIVEYEAAFTNLAEYAPHLVATDEMRARRFEDGLRYEIKRVIRPLVLPTYADVLDRAIIVEQDEMEKKKYFDNKKRQNFNNQGSSGQKRQKPESNWRNQRGQIPTCPTCGKNHSGECWRKRPDVICFYCNEVGHIKRNCPKLGTGAMRGNQGGGNARPGENRQGNQGNRSGTGNNQRQGQAFALMPGDARNDEIVVAEMGPQSIVRINV
ncbi:hypothetical protein Acr_05g0011070 [Actinidia rufa]|uniref:CCHC-type domain-containing protein n=1 Tax=Actinidia rufa TaxID=165716 RepID=A0A7J0ELX1_9ERIC|nr:hypothetical protein Acr_05g0011070 [Actinidia rufa]